MQTVAPTPAGSAVQGPMNVAEAANALAGMLPDEGQEDSSEAQLPDEGAAVDEELLADADAADDETDTEQSELDEDTEEQEQPQVFSVKVDGKEVDVTLEELQKGYSRTQDYTRKTQQIAEARKQTEAELQAVRAEREQYAQLLSALESQVQQVAQPNIDWDRLYQEDPIEWVRQREVMRENQEKAAAIQSEKQRLNQLSQQEQAQFMQQKLQHEQEALLAAIPDWKDAKKAQAEKALLVEFGQKIGFTPDELKNVVDHRAVLMLRKAALYDQMMSKRGNIKPVTNNGPRPAKPGAAGRISNNTEAVRAQQRVAKTGRVDDAANAIFQLLK
jgi:DNA repair exonuclease SbcCD ATPase subunit